MFYLNIELFVSGFDWIFRILSICRDTRVIIGIYEQIIHIMLFDDDNR